MVRVFHTPQSTTALGHGHAALCLQAQVCITRDLLWLAWWQVDCVSVHSMDLLPELFLSRVCPDVSSCVMGRHILAILCGDTSS